MAERKTKTVEVVPYNPEWKTEFEKIKEMLNGYIGDLILAIEHVGSTSVEGLAAKPIIDLDVVISSYDVLPSIIERLNKAGYEHEGNLGVEGREAFRRTHDDGLMKYHLYVCPRDGKGYLEHIAFRDYLRSSETARKEYEELKLKLAQTYRNDIDKYCLNKTKFIANILNKTLYRIDAKLIGRGRTADIYEHKEGNVLKLYKQDFPTDAIHQEFAVSKFVFSLGIKTPQPFEIIQVSNRTGVVFERVLGISLLKEMTSNPWSIDKQSKKLAKLHHELHLHQTDEGLQLLRHQKEVLIYNINRAPFLSGHEKEKIINYLQELPAENKLCHGDFHPDNALVGEDNFIIDWMTGMIGNPAGDVARTVILLSFGVSPEGTPKIIAGIVNILRNRVKSVYLKQYLKLSGFDSLEIDRWILPVAAARLTERIPDEEKKNLLNLIRERLRAIS